MMAGPSTTAVDRFMVPDGLGSIRGLLPEQHIEWACSMDFEHFSYTKNADDDLLFAVEWEASHSVSFIKDYREERD